MPVRDVSSWNALISGYMREESLEKVGDTISSVTEANHVDQVIGMKDVKGSKYVPLKLKVASQNFVIGTLSVENTIHQMMFDLVFEKAFEFNFMAKPSFTFDGMENDDDMKRGLAAIESESENAHRRYQQLLGFKKPLLKIVSSIGENEMDSQQNDYVQQMMVSLPGPSFKTNRKIALLGVLYGEKCKAVFDSVSKSVQTLQGLRRVLMNYLIQKHSNNLSAASRFVVMRSPNSCYGCASTFVTQCLEILQVLSKHPSSKKLLVSSGILRELFENNIHQGPKTARVQARGHYVPSQRVM